MALSLACCPACYSFCCVVVLVVLIDVTVPPAPAAAPAAAASSVVRSAKTHCRSGGFSYCKFGVVFPYVFLKKKINRHRYTRRYYSFVKVFDPRVRKRHIL